MSNLSQKRSDPRWVMRWFLFATYLFAFLASLATGIILAFQTKALTPFVIPTPLLIAMQPIIRFLFVSSTRK